MNTDGIINTDRLAAYVTEGNRHKYLKEYGLAEKAYKDALACTEIIVVKQQRERITAEIDLALADMYCLQNEFTRSIEYYGRILAIDPQKPEIHLNLGRCYRKIVDCDQAEKALVDALACIEKIGDKQQREQLVVEICLELGDICTVRSEFEKSIEYYGKILALDVQKPEIHRNLGRCYQKLGECGMAEKAYADALACIEKIGDKRQREQVVTEINLELGDIYNVQSEFAKSAECYERILAIDANNPEIHLILGRCYRKLGENGLAEKAYTDALACIDNIGDQRQKEQVMVEIDLDLADMYSLQSAFGKSIEYYGKILAIDPQKPEICLNLGRCYRKFGDYDQAGKAYEDALACIEHIRDDQLRERVVKEINLELGDICGLRSEFGKSIEYYGKILAIDGTKPELHLNLGRCYQKLGEYGLAEKAYGDVIACAEKCGDKKLQEQVVTEVNFELAGIYSMQYEYGKSIECYENILAIDGQKPEIHLNLGRCYQKLGEYGLAEKAYRAAIALLENREQTGDDRGETWLQLAAVHKELGNYSRALEYLSRAKLADQDNVNVDRALGEVHLMQKEYARAIKIFESLLEKEPDAIDIYRPLGFAYRGIGDDKKTLECFCRVQEKYKNNLDLVRNMGEIFLRQGDYDRGIELLQGYLQGAPGKNEERGELYLLLARFYFMRGERKDAATLLREYLKTIEEKNVFLANKTLSIAEYLDGKSVVKSKPMEITVAVTTRCNLRCLMCGVCKNDYDIPEKTVREIMELFPYLEQITWIGGEVFLSKYFEELLDASLAYPNIYSRIIMTNGLLLTEPVIEKYIKHAVILTLSIDGMTRPTYERIRRGGRYDDLLRNLEIIAKYRAQYGQTKNNRLRMNYVVMKSNYREIVYIPEFCERYGFNCVHLLRLCPHEGIEEENLENDPVALDYLGMMVPQVVARMEALNIEIRLDRYFCNMDVTDRSTKHESGVVDQPAAERSIQQESGVPDRTNLADRSQTYESPVAERTDLAFRSTKQESDARDQMETTGQLTEQENEAREQETVNTQCSCGPREENDEIKTSTYLFDAYVSYCRAPWRKLTLQADCFAYSECDCLLPVGDFTKQSILEIWNGEMMQRYRHALKNKTDLEICNKQCLTKKNLYRDVGTISF